MQTHSESLDRMLEHMAWANAHLFDSLAQLPDAALTATAPGSEWSVGAIAHHLVHAAVNYARRLNGEPRTDDIEKPSSAADIHALKTTLAGADLQLRTAAKEPGEATISWTSLRGEAVSVPRWVVVNQAVHHATEHRAQIAGALAANGITSIDLDALDVWSLNDELSR